MSGLSGSSGLSRSSNTRKIEKARPAMLAVNRNASQTSLTAMNMERPMSRNAENWRVFFKRGGMCWRLYSKREEQMIKTSMMKKM